MTCWPRPSLRHLAQLTDEVGIVEHARLDKPRRELGYCTDDAGRLLAVASKMTHSRDARRLATVALAFLRRAHDHGASFRLHLGGNGRWSDDPPSDDAAGRALLGLGTAASAAPWPEVRSGALDLFEAASGFRSAHPRAIAYAALGAVALLGAMPGHEGARRLVDDAANLLPGPSPEALWRWPEPRLTYANALIPEACLATAAVLGDRRRVGDGLALLYWLIGEERRGDRFSFVPVGGRAEGRQNLDQGSELARHVPRRP
jgi:hypothetical protein